jgi:L-iditol 2-dehydrogenase
MFALVLTEPGKFAVRDAEKPAPGPGEALCRVRAVAICGSDPEIIHGGLAGTWPPAYPFIPGHEWAGQVESVGPGVVGLKPGDRVAGEAHKGCGWCRNCLSGSYNLCLNYGNPDAGHRHYGFVSSGAYAQYIACSRNMLTKMPENVSFLEGALVDTAGVALHGLELSGVPAGGSVAVVGPGPIGLIAMRLAKALGAARVIMVGRGARLEKAGRMGAERLIDIRAQEPVEAVRKATGGLGVDLAVECSGAQGTLAQCVGMVRKGGRVVLLGVPPDHVREELPFKYIVHNEITIHGSRANPNVAAKVLELLSAGRLAVKDLITHTYALAEFAQALETFEQRRDGAIKVVVEPNEREAR